MPRLNAATWTSSELRDLEDFDVRAHADPPSFFRTLLGCFFWVLPSLPADLLRVRNEFLRAHLLRPPRLHPVTTFVLSLVGPLCRP